ncbi:Uncharacterized protein OBRU01_13545 [Operophtera brumata]|uniref:Uncharacterized protein n=1 Tax=Operophtera brumata TaxID=104452 RepID=A0A0L7KWW7_OPEBR|nr:Uncharacterized protein OBRU01_13545 [Operophtera brumata]
MKKSYDNITEILNCSKPVAKCKTVKNPCKICFKPVTQKTGLKCNGACQAWIHYSCLHYTPGRLKDIKAGIIKINCPCPDCVTLSPKEYRTDLPKSCPNTDCPVNKFPKCENKGCPSNSDSAVDDCDKQKKEKVVACQAPGNQIATQVSSGSTESGGSCAGGKPKPRIGGAPGVQPPTNAFDKHAGVIEKFIVNLGKTVDQLANEITQFMTTMNQAMAGQGSGAGGGGRCPVPRNQNQNQNRIN